MPDEARRRLVRGMTRDVGNAIDEFIVTTLRNFLLGLPLDLPALNIARGRDTGVPSLNETRAAFFDDVQQPVALHPYTGWTDFQENIKNPLSVINFIAAYGNHAAHSSLRGRSDSGKARRGDEARLRRRRRPAGRRSAASPSIPEVLAPMPPASRRPGQCRSVDRRPGRSSSPSSAACSARRSTSSSSSSWSTAERRPLLLSVAHAGHALPE